jgi:eukaryotic-like serine/threonine-protein kinase
VYVADDRTLLALDAATGRVRWQTPLNNTTSVRFGNGLALAGNVLVVHDRRGDGTPIVHGLDPATGTRRWSLPPGGQASTRGPIITDELVYVSAEDGSTSAYDVTTGAHRWSLPESSNTLLAARGNDAYVGAATSVQAISGP